MQQPEAMLDDLEAENPRFHMLLGGLLADRVKSNCHSINCQEPMADTGAITRQMLLGTYSGWESPFPDLKRLSKRIKAHDFTTRQLSILLVIYESIRSEEGITISIDCDHATRSEMFNAMFTHIRVGHYDEAILLAEQCARFDVSATLRGAPGFMSDHRRELTAAGSDTIDLWLTAAAGHAKTCPDPYEAAVYGVFSGEVEPLMTVAETAEDRAWALLTCMLHTRLVDTLNGLLEKVDSESIKPLPSPSQAPALRGLTIGDVFTHTTTGWGHSPALIAEAHVITGDYDAALSVLESASPSDLDAAFAMAVLTLRDDFGLDLNADAVHQVVIRHLDNLLRSGRPRDVLNEYARFTSKLDATTHPRLMAELVGPITDTEGRLTALQAMAEHGIDTAAVALVTADGLFDRYHRSNDDDELGVAVNAVQWLCFDPALRVQAIGRAVRYCRRLVAIGGAHLAREMLLNVIPAGYSKITSDSAVEVVLVRSLNAIDLFVETYHCFSNFLSDLDSESAQGQQIQAQRLESIISGFDMVLSDSDPWLIDRLENLDPTVAEAVIAAEGGPTSRQARADSVHRAQVAAFTAACDMLAHVAGLVPERRRECAELVAIGAAHEHVLPVLKACGFISGLLQKVALLLSETPAAVDFYRAGEWVAVS
ncbi:Nuclear pore protein 84/107 [Carpediemonas membranifera]|uniref:Nuclear pore complex protein n=1 Tax=Carpediemonas membranifera TaxID=201153 RepID=A0A8J6B8D2_9EUKA|nr:Nuclear pore protein 84/107 [Carpediemonas membranifera]|eukprot:KAG9396364.1 Nuclear pore protein 84/107 [Carpediemonas membranifera]